MATTPAGCVKFWAADRVSNLTLYDLKKKKIYVSDFLPPNGVSNIQQRVLLSDPINKRKDK